MAYMQVRWVDSPHTPPTGLSPIYLQYEVQRADFRIARLNIYDGFQVDWLPLGAYATTVTRHNCKAGSVRRFLISSLHSNDKVLAGGKTNRTSLGSACPTYLSSSSQHPVPLTRNGILSLHRDLHPTSSVYKTDASLSMLWRQFSLHSTSLGRGDQRITMWSYFLTRGQNFECGPNSFFDTLQYRQ